MSTTTDNPPAAAPGKYVPPGRRRQMEEEARHATSNPRVSKPMDDMNGVRQGGHVADRWKNLDAEDSGPPRAVGGRWGDRPNNGSQTSQTGTQWDIRDRRNWKPESESTVFKQDKDKSIGLNFDKYDSIPVELSGSKHETIEVITSFRETRGIHPLLAANIIRVNYERPTPVQKNSIPVVLSGRDLMACAQTGSGKTAAFLFPIITKMLTDGPPPNIVNNSAYRTRMPAYPVALVISPTRELAVQIYEESCKFAFRTGIRTVVLYGGSEVRTQTSELDRGCDICVATPGRLSDLITRGNVGLRLVKYFVLDEADRMLDMGFAPQINGIVHDHDMPKSKDGRQTIMFSATFPNQIQTMASDFLHDYMFLTVGRVGSTNDFISQHFVYTEEDSKPRKLLSLLGETKGLVLIFVETKRKADLIQEFLLNNDLPAVTIHGDKSQPDRERALDLFRTGKRSILVATDVAARGLDIHNIEHVINCDLPSKIDDYVHRIGRTGRAGNRGKATSFVNECNRGLFRDLQGLLEEADQDIPPWFSQMVKQCTQAYKGSYGGGGGSAFSRGPGRGGNRNSNFGSRDVRSDRSAAPSRFGDITRSGADVTRSGGPSRVVEEEEEDGW